MEKRVSEPGSAFAGYPPSWTFTEGPPALDLPQPPVPASPAEALAGDPPGAPFLGLGRVDLAVAALPARGAQVEVADAATGQVVLSRTLAEAAPPADQPWQPMEFLAAVDTGGLVGSLVVTVPSGARPVDAYFRRYLAEILRWGSG